ncbi:LysR family transcriptional regulator [Aeromicrobium sp. Root495]|uniref:LysR family transcriptional regulator n=1 Tax=Aeromicrobium sp. Root495 TaxID=1736550 RepID=UPI0006F3DC0D|nr:LysR substrate-binding domain-containing protein [Aeromicrobium sp. Root495]KQY60008.1 LysR family transcriptional regulator [Aeromicrobium sp. Root495]
MQFQQLSYFVAVARTRHFTQAADLMGVAQPSLSKQIRVLENSLGTPLFVRNRGGIELTSAGEALLPHAERVLIDVESAQRAVHEVAGLQRGRVRLGATPSLCDGLLPEVLTHFHTAHPDIELEIHEAGSRVLARELAQGRLDLALLIAPREAVTDDIVATPVMRERLVLAAPPGSPLPDEVDVAELSDVPLVMFREGYDLRDVTIRAFEQAGVKPRLSVEGGEMSAVLRFVEAGLGHAVVPEMVMSNRPTLRSIRIRRPSLRREIALAHRAETLQLAARAFQEELLTQLGEFRPRAGT